MAGRGDATAKRGDITAGWGNNIEARRDDDMEARRDATPCKGDTAATGRNDTTAGGTAAL